MATVDINGTLVDFPDNLTPDQLQKAVSSAAGQIGGQPKKGLMRRGWDALAVPEQKSREGLRMLADMVPKPEPKGNLAMDVAKGTPRVFADTLAEAAPGFVSRGSILTAGASKIAKAAAPLAKTALRSIGAQGEEMSGIAPKAVGALEAAYKDPTLIFSKGKKAAGSLYEAGKAEMQSGTNLFKGMYKPDEIWDTAKAYLDKGGKLEPAEALMARKAIDSLMRSGRYVKDELLAARNVLDDMAKASSNISQADKTFRRGLNAEALRNVFPQNKYGGASGFKTALGTFIAGLPGGKLVAAPMLSPAVQGALATGAGIAARQAVGPLASSPGLAAGGYSALQAALAARREKKEKR